MLIYVWKPLFLLLLLTINVFSPEERAARTCVKPLTLETFADDDVTGTGRSARRRRRRLHLSLGLLLGNWWWCVRDDGGRCGSATPRPGLGLFERKWCAWRATVDGWLVVWIGRRTIPPWRRWQFIGFFSNELQKKESSLFGTIMGKSSLLGGMHARACYIHSIPSIN